MLDLLDRTRERLARVSDALDQFAEEYELAGPPGDYVFAGWSLVNKRLLDDNPELAAHVDSINGEIPSVRLPFSARELYLRTDARVIGFDLAPHVTAKIVARRQFQSSLHREKTARRALSGHLANSPHIALPALYAYGKRGMWLTEEFVEGERATPAELEAFLTGGAALDFYGATARLRSVGHRPSTLKLLHDLTDFDPSFPRIDERACLPVGIIHGDLQTHNLLVGSEGTFWPVDMGRANVAPIAMDLARIYRENTDILDAILALLRQLDPAGSALPAEYQFALAIVAQTQHFVSYGGDADNARTHVKDLFAAFIDRAG
jgi:hypothetical protein